MQGEADGRGPASKRSRKGARKQARKRSRKPVADTAGPRGTDLGRLEQSQFRRSAELARRLDRGDMAAAPELKTRPSIGQRRSGLTAEDFFLPCRGPQPDDAPYLMETDIVDGARVARIIDGAVDYNRMTWWDKADRVPPSGPIDKRFRCEFNAPLTSIVGSNLDDHATQGYRTVDWSGVTTPNAVVGAGFGVRVKVPDSMPEIVSGAGYHTAEDPDPQATGYVLINSGFPGDPPRELGEEEFRPSLWIDFDEPQRAVGLEFGVAGIPDDLPQQMLPRSRNAKLFAYDADGAALADVLSDANFINIVEPQSRLMPDFISHQVGVRDELGRISSVELRLEHLIGDGGEKHTAPQIVHRIWSEPLPPAAVFQGALAADFNTGGMSGLPGLRDGVAASPHTVELPYQFNRAAAFLRGFRLEFLDARPHEVRHFGAQIKVPDVLETQPGGDVTLEADGWLTTDETPAVPYRITAYYSLVAWHTERAELFSAFQWISGSSQDRQQEATIALPDPSPNPPLYPPPAAGEAGRGPVWGGLQFFQFVAANRPGDAQGVDRFEISLGGHKPGGGDTIARVGLGMIHWQTRTLFDGKDSNEHTRSLGGTVLTGRSLRAADGIESFTVSLGPVTRRDPGDWLVTVDRNNQYAFDIECDMPFLGVHQMLIAPKGKIREIDVEAQATWHNGGSLAWRTGGGLLNSEDDDKELTHAVALMLPQAAGVIRRALVARGHIATQDLRFSGVVGQTSEADQIGVLYNSGDAPVLLSGFAKGTEPVDALFDYLFLLPDHTSRFGATLRVRLAELAQYEPIRLAPGDSILVGGLYTPNAPAGGLVGLGHVGLLTATANNGQAVGLVAIGAAIAANPAGHWEPAQLDFGPFVGGETESALLVTTGTTPLQVNGLYLEDPDIGFSFTRPPVVDAVSDVMRVLVTYDPEAPSGGRTETRLIAETDAGDIALPVVYSALR